MTAIVRIPTSGYYREQVVRDRDWLLRHHARVSRFYILRSLPGTLMELHGHPYVLRAKLIDGRIFEEGWPDAGLALTWCKRRIFTDKPMNYLGVETRCRK